MDNKSENDTLKRAIGEFAPPFETLDETISVSIKLDALVSALLKTSFAERRVGQKRLKKLSSGTMEAPAILREIGGERFKRAAKLADMLDEITRSSLITLDSSLMDEADTYREAFFEEFQDLLPLIVGQQIERNS